MAKRTPPTPDGPRLFEHHEHVTLRAKRRQHALFIPRYLEEIAAEKRLAGPAQDNAHAIAVRWADLYETGKLASLRETTIDTQFLDQMFSEGLGYALKTKSPAAWQLEHKYPVEGVGIADGALGDFPAAPSPAVIIELKDASTDLDRTRINGRSPVRQCWDYLNALPDCPWGIVSNFAAIRLYHRSKGIFAYEEFTLPELRNRERFNQFYALFERGGLLPSRLAQVPRTGALLDRTQKQQKQVGDALYDSYRTRRLLLIDHLIRDHKKPFDEAIAIAQKLLDRVIFIAFCEDRDLIPSDALKRARTDVSAYGRVVNKRWHNFLGLFEAMDRGGNGKRPIPPFNGTLFKPDPAIDTLELDDEPWAEALAGFGDYDFSEEVNVEVLGHLFERSITELERLRVGGLFALKAAAEAETRATGFAALGDARGKAPKTPAPRAEAEPAISKMPKSAQRKRFGVYYTPPAFTGLIVERTVDALVRERFLALAAKHGVDPDARADQDQKKLARYWAAGLDELKTITVCDPACGSGAFLIRAYEALEAHYKTVVHGLGGSGILPEEVARIEASIPDLILTHNLYGVDLSHEAVEIAQLALWIRTARRDKTLTDLSKHIIRGNSLVSDKSVDPHAIDWKAAFPSIFPSTPPRGTGVPPVPTPSTSSSSSPPHPGGFSCVIGNPPWERVKLQEREFFSLTDPQTAESVNAADRRKRIEAMPKANPDLYAKYEAAQESAGRMLDYARKSGEYPLTGKGDVNLYMLFAERAKQLVAPDGVVGLLVPSGIATDDTTKGYFNDLMDRKALISLYDFENRKGHFADVDGRFKFTALVFGGQSRTTEQADFVFFAHDVEDTAEPNRKRHIALTAADMKLLNPNTRTCPIFRTRRDADLTRDIYRRVPILIDENRKQGGNPWGVRFFTMFHQTNDAEHFKEAKAWDKRGYKLAGNVYIKGKSRALPLYEAKMVQAFDHRAASVIVEDDNWVRQGQKAETTPVEHTNPEFAVQPRWWVAADRVAAVTEGRSRDWLLAYKDITSATNERTMIAAFLPSAAVVNSAPIMFVGEGVAPRREACLLANLNSFVYDFVARQKVGSVHLNFFIVEQLPTLPPATYGDKCPWSKRDTLEHWISERVLKLSCTAEDMIPLATACDFKGGRGDGVHVWKESERAQLRAELDAAYFILYGVSRPDAEYMLSTFTHTGYIPDDQRQPNTPRWDPTAIGHAILDAYDHLTGLHAGGNASMRDR